jgi:hypothetical protein
MTTSTETAVAAAAATTAVLVPPPPPPAGVLVLPAAALVFGASGEEGRAVVEGLVNCGRYQYVYAFTRHYNNNKNKKSHHHDATAVYLRDGLGATLLSYDDDNDDNDNTAAAAGGGGVGGGGADLENIDHVERALTETRATAIFLVTTTELPTTMQTNMDSYSYSDAAEAEFQTICNFFKVLKKVQAQAPLTLRTAHVGHE